MTTNAVNHVVNARFSLFITSAILFTSWIWPARADQAWPPNSAQRVNFVVIMVDDGKQISECPLPAMPVFDGLSAANDLLYIAALDGKILCYGAIK